VAVNPPGCRALEPTATGYRKRAGPEQNWVWSPQGLVNMHLPELWGVVQFGGTPRPMDDRAERWALRRVFYAQRAHHASTRAYSTELTTIGLTDLRDRVRLAVTGRGYVASVQTASGDSLPIRGGRLPGLRLTPHDFSMHRRDFLLSAAAALAARGPRTPSPVPWAWVHGGDGTGAQWRSRFRRIARAGTAGCWWAAETPSSCRRQHGRKGSSSIAGSGPSTAPATPG
jgi:hypothetical protein